MDMMPSRYTAYNLRIDSDIWLPELDQLSFDPLLADVKIRKADAPKERLEGGEDYGDFFRFKADGFWMHIPEVARYLVENGDTILVDPEPGIDGESLRIFLLGSALGALLFQRGYLVLHGNAIRIGDRCLICVGDSGAGKSSIAAGFLQRGYDVLADDVVPVDAEARALPGFPRIKLWQDAADQLNIDTRNLPRIRPNLDKFSVPFTPHRDMEPLPIGWIYVIEKSDKIDNEFTYIRGHARFEALHKNTYRVEYLEGLKLRPHHIRGCANLASRVHLARVTRPVDRFGLDALIDNILQDIAKNPAD